MTIVTIRGKMGSGAPEVGKLVAQRLHIDYFDRKIIGLIASNLNIHEQEIDVKETPPCTIQERLTEMLCKSLPTSPGFPGTYLPMSEIPLDDSRYVEALSSLIKNIASSRSAVIYGRGSQFILKDFPGTIHVSTIAPFEIRLARIMKILNLDEKKAREEILHFDNSAQVFMRRYFNTKMEDPCHYNLVIDTGCFDFEAAAQLVVEATRQDARRWTVY